MKAQNRLLLMALALGGWAWNGCNTEPVWEERQEVEGPTTDMSSPEGVELPAIVVADASEVDLVEQVLTHRALYHRSLQALQDFYRNRGNEQKRRWAATELASLEEVQPFKYLLNAEIPPESLRPVDSIAEADALYNQGRDLMRQGGHGVPALYRQDLMIQALQAFTGLIRQYPSSDKIDDAAFYCGEIHKEYLKSQEPLAVQWYERAYSWDPATPHPARFQAAVTYDYRLHDRARALELYRRVIQEETDNRSNVSFAVARVDELTRGEPTGSTPSDVVAGRVR